MRKREGGGGVRQLGAENKQKTRQPVIHVPGADPVPASWEHKNIPIYSPSVLSAGAKTTVKLTFVKINSSHKVTIYRGLNLHPSRLLVKLLPLSYECQ